jgi:DNA-binding NtrC family response regulator
LARFCRPRRPTQLKTIPFYKLFNIEQYMPAGAAQNVFLSDCDNGDSGSVQGGKQMEGHPHALVASSHLEPRRALLRILEDLSVNTFASATLAEAEDFLSRQEVVLVFCDDHLTDGSYRDLLRTLGTWEKAPRIVVTTRTGEWKEYMEALRLGAFDMIPYPYRSTDVELNVRRAMRGENQEFDRASA